MAPVSVYGLDAVGAAAYGRQGRPGALVEARGLRGRRAVAVAAPAVAVAAAAAAAIGSTVAAPVDERD